MNKRKGHEAQQSDIETDRLDFFKLGTPLIIKLADMDLAVLVEDKKEEKKSHR